MINVGWRTAGKRFEVGLVDAEVRDGLVRLAVEPANVMRGLHDCDVFGAQSPIWMVTDYSPDGCAALGAGGIRVRGEDGTVFCAPTLIIVDDHGYRPPEEFLRAVRAARRHEGPAIDPADVVARARTGVEARTPGSAQAGPEARIDARSVGVRP
jgi:hypothetical protein